MSSSLADAPVETAVPISEAPGGKLALLRKLLLSRSGRHWALADQAAASIGNYITTIIVVHTLSAANLGAFGMLYEVYLFLNGVHAALVIYPLSFRGAVMDEKDLRRFSTGALSLAMMLAFPLLVGMAATGLYFGGISVAIAAAAALIAYQVQETMRRTLMAHLRFADAIPGDAISYLLQACVLLVLASTHHLTILTTFWSMAVTSGLAAAVQAFQIGLRKFPASELKVLAQDFWKNGRYIFFAGLTTLVAGMSYNWTLFLSHGVVEVGRFQMLGTLQKFGNPIVTALSGAMLPAIARAAASGIPGQKRRVFIKFAGLAGMLLLPLFLFVEIWPEFCIRLIGNSHPEYMAYIHQLSAQLRVIMFTYMVGAGVAFAFAYLNGLGESKANFYSWSVNGIVTLVVSIPLVIMYGLWGVVIGGMIGCISLAITAGYFFLRHRRQPAQPEARGLEVNPEVTAVISPEVP